MRGKEASSPKQKGEQYAPLMGDQDMAAQPGTAPTQGSHSLRLSPAAPLVGI
jgi:hypothetical protein